MKNSQLNGFKWFMAALLVLGVVKTQAQTATWIGPASGGEWNTAANWDLGMPPGVVTNALIGNGTNVTYSLPMSATTFGTLTTRGVLNVNTNNFNCTGVFMTLPGSQAKLLITNNGVMNVAGSLGFSSNSVVLLSAGGSLNVNGTLIIGCGTSGGTGSTTVSSFGTMTNNGGTLNANATTLNPGNASITSGALLVINGGTNDLGTVSIRRSAAGSGGFSTLGTEGLVINGGVVTMTNANIGAGSGNSFLTTYITGGLVTNVGSVFINQGSSARGSRLLQTGGLLVVPDPGVVNLNPTVSGSLNNFAVLGGTNISGGLFLGNSNLTSAGTINVTNGATIYVGSQGIANNGVATVTVALNGGGMFGATAPWTGSQAMKLTGGTFTFQTADMNGTANNITLTAPLSGTGGLRATGGGTLTLGGANIYSGNTFINGGTLALASGATLTSPQIFVASGTTLDVSQTGGFTLGAGQILSGAGTVTGAVATVGTSIIYPGSNSVTGTLTFMSGLTETGGTNNQFVLSSDPNGPGNDFINVQGGLNLSGVNTISIIGALQTGGAYPLFGYNGNLTGGVANLAVIGATGVFSNSVASSTIYFIPQSSIRNATNITWVGNSVNNNWDVEATTNWVNAGTGALDYFVSGDFTLFNNLGVANGTVNIPGTVMPGTVVVSTTGSYTFQGGGAIGGLASVTVSNGTLNVLTVNTYTGPTILAGGDLVTALLANSGSPSGIGQATTDPANIIFNGGTLTYNGASVATDHGMTLTNAGGTIDVIGGTTLTLNGALIGNGGLTKVDNGNLVLANPNSYTNTTVMNGGTLTVNAGTALGSGSVLLSAGDLALGAVKPGNSITAAGGWISGGNAGGSTGIKNVTGSANLGIVVTTGVFDLTGDMTTYSGTITFTNGGGATVRFNGATGSQLATWDLGAGPMDLNIRTGSTDNEFGALEGAVGTTLSGRGGSGNNGGTTHYIGFNNLSTTFDGKIQDGSGGSSSTTAVTKVGTGTLSLSGANTYTGTTTISNGVLALINDGNGDGSIGNSAVINIIPGAVLDASGISSGIFPLGGSQALRGRGTINGNLNAGGIVEPGGGPGGGTGALTVTTNITLSGTAWMKLSRTSSPTSDELVSAHGNITYGGTLVVTNIGGALQVNDTFTLFAGGGLSGGTFATVTLPNYYTWDTSNLGVNGSIKVAAILPPPALTNVDFSQLVNGSITLNAVNGAPNGPVKVMTSTNLALPVTSWTTVTSTTFDVSGNLNVAVSVNPASPASFYALLAQ